MLKSVFKPWDYTQDFKVFIETWLTHDYYYASFLYISVHKIFTDVSVESECAASPNKKVDNSLVSIRNGKFWDFKTMAWDSSEDWILENLLIAVHNTTFSIFYLSVECWHEE